MGQAAEGHRDQQELGQGRRPRHGHPGGVPALRARHGHRGLDHGHEQGQHQGEMADLDDHLAPSLVTWPWRFMVSDISSHLPDCLSASATSGGM